MLFDIFFKTKGGKSTLNTSTTYYNKLATIESSNFDEFNQKAQKVISDIGMGEFEVDGKGIDYENAKGTGRLPQDFSTSHT